MLLHEFCSLENVIPSDKSVLSKDGLRMLTRRQLMSDDDYCRGRSCNSLEDEVHSIVENVLHVLHPKQSRDPSKGFAPLASLSGSTLRIYAMTLPRKATGSAFLPLLVCGFARKPVCVFLRSTESPFVCDSTAGNGGIFDFLEWKRWDGAGWTSTVWLLAGRLVRAFD
ncbi:hypothetical protein K0M31_020039 [Melipona bicolor]|uniref:Uncharacterized protein n=1 Tax=Melipona bicolor TaxID=60889 RepID=A0AA40G0M4_9HYME|nr:hypothetical protein K0M31_020039 [Melipona bicolor]